MAKPPQADHQPVWVCSRCHRVCNSRSIHITPALHEGSTIVTTRRCDDCFKATIVEIEDKVRAGPDKEFVAEFLSFLRRYGMTEAAQEFRDVGVERAKVLMAAILNCIYEHDPFRYVVVEKEDADLAVRTIEYPEKWSDRIVHFFQFQFFLQFTVLFAITRLGRWYYGTAKPLGKKVLRKFKLDL